MVERFHRTLKTGLAAYESPRWMHKLSIVLLALRNTVKPDLGCTPAELVYGMSLRLPGELFHPAPSGPVPRDIVRVLRDSMSQIWPSPSADHRGGFLSLQTYRRLRTFSYKLTPGERPYNPAMKVPWQS